MDEKAYENNLYYNSLYKNKQNFKIDGFIRVYDGSRNLVLFGRGKHDSIFDRIRYIISAKSGITCITFHSYAKIKVNLHNSLLLKKTIFHAIILIKSVFNKDKNNYHHNMFLEKSSYQLSKKQVFV